MSRSLLLAVSAIRGRKNRPNPGFHVASMPSRFAKRRLPRRQRRHPDPQQVWPAARQELGVSATRVAATIPKTRGEPARVQPSRRRKSSTWKSIRATQADALAGLGSGDSGSDAAVHLEPVMLVDSMRGRFHTWTRIRVNLQHVPEELRPEQEALDRDDPPDDWAGVSGATRRKPSRARKGS